MSKATSGWQEVLNKIVKDKQTHTLGGWLCAGAIVTCLWVWNWKLFLATSAGIGSMSATYLLQNSYWQRYCRQWQSFLTGSNRQLILAVGSGATGAFCTYLAASVWADAENQWLATGFILQGMASLTILSVLLWSLSRKKDNKKVEDKLDRLLEDLSHSNSLKRLVAIRQLTRLLVNQQLPPDSYSQSIEYFYLMLSETQIPVIENALLESLNLLDADPSSKPKYPKVKIPLQLNYSRICDR